MRRTLYLYDTRTGERTDLGRFFAPPELANDFRVDLHPRWSRDGRALCFDSAHEPHGELGRFHEQREACATTRALVRAGPAQQPVGGHALRALPEAGDSVPDDGQRRVLLLEEAHQRPRVGVP